MEGRKRQGLVRVKQCLPRSAKHKKYPTDTRNSTSRRVGFDVKALFEGRNETRDWSTTYDSDTKNNLAHVLPKLQHIVLSKLVTHKNNIAYLPIHRYRHPSFCSFRRAQARVRTLYTTSTHTSTEAPIHTQRTAYSHTIIPS